MHFYTHTLTKLYIYPHRWKSRLKLPKCLSQPLAVWVSCCCLGWEISFFRVLLYLCLVMPWWILLRLSLSDYFLYHCAQSWVPDVLQDLNILSVGNGKKKIAVPNMCLQGKHCLWDLVTSLIGTVSCPAFWPDRQKTRWYCLQQYIYILASVGRAIWEGKSFRYNWWW